MSKFTKINIKWRKIARYLKCQKCVIFCFHNNNIFRARLFQNVFCIILLDFSSIFYDFLEVRLTGIEIMFLFLLFSLWPMGFWISCFHCFQNSITLDRKIIFTSGFHQFLAQTVLYKVVYKTPHKIAT